MRGHKDIKGMDFIEKLECLWYLKDSLFSFLPKETSYGGLHMYPCRCHSGDQCVVFNMPLIKSLGIFIFLTTHSQPQIPKPSAVTGWRMTM